MRMTMLLVLLVLSLFIVSCASQSTDLPPEPGTPGKTLADGGDLLGKAYAGYTAEGYAPPVDVFDDDKQVVFLEPPVAYVEFDDGSLVLDKLEVDYDGTKGDTFVYYLYNVWNPRLAKWVEYPFKTETYKNSHWIKDTGKGVSALSEGVQLDARDYYDGRQYVATYSCRKMDGKWKCGYDAKGNSNQWMLSTFVRQTVDEMPPEPESLGALVTKSASVYPLGEIVNLGADVRLGVDMRSEQADLDELESVRVLVRNSDGSVSNEIVLKPDSAFGHMKCSDDGFECSRWYEGTLLMDAEGEYAVTFVGADASTFVSDGKFRVSRFDDHLVGPVTGWTVNSNGWWDADMDTYASYYNNDDFDDWYLTALSYLDMTTDGRLVTRAQNGLMFEKSRLVSLTVDGLPQPQLIYTSLGRITNYKGGQKTATYTNYVWVSGNHFFRLYSLDKLEDIKDIIDAYLTKFPSEITRPSCMNGNLDPVTGCICDKFDDLTALIELDAGNHECVAPAQTGTGTGDGTTTGTTTEDGTTGDTTGGTTTGTTDGTTSTTTPDKDGDGVADADDNCPDDANANQLNTDEADGDTTGDVCDTDDDGDDVLDGPDNCPLVFNDDQADGINPDDAAEPDGVGDACDDSDGDGDMDDIDPCPGDPLVNVANGDPFNPVCA